MLIGLGAVVGGAGVLSGSGAFSAVQAERGFDVSTAGDSSALLALAAATVGDGTEGDLTANADKYVVEDGNTLSVDIAGINLDAITHLHDVFTVTNNGSQSVALYFEEVVPDGSSGNSSAIDIGVRADQLTDSASEDESSGEGIADHVFDDDTDDIFDVSYPDPPSDGNPSYSTNGIELPTGESVDLGVYVDTSDGNLNDGLDEDGEGVSGTGDSENPNLLDSLVVWAEAGEVDNAAYTVQQSGGGSN
jgi:hypothetical protein